MRRKSKRPKGIMIAVFKMSAELYGDLVVGSHEVQFAEDGSTMERNGEILDVWNRLLVNSSDIVECTVISTGAPITWSLLGDHVGRR